MFNLAFGPCFFLLFASISLKTTCAVNLHFPTFANLVKDFPHPDEETVDSISNSKYSDFFDNYTLFDYWKHEKSQAAGVAGILDDRPITVILDSMVYFNRLEGESFTTIRYPELDCLGRCYTVTTEDMLQATGKTIDYFENTAEILEVHLGIIKVIESRFCCNFNDIATSLGLSDGVNEAGSDYSVWQMFIPRITENTIQCKADQLGVTTAELAELLGTNLSTLLSYGLDLLDSTFFPQFDNLLARKNLFETRSVLQAGFPLWQDKTMSELAQAVAQFTPRHLEILYEWNSPQLHAIENIPLSIYQSCCGTASISLVQSLLDVSKNLFGHSTNLPTCDQAFLLSRSLNEVNTKYTPASLTTSNSLETYSTGSGVTNWFSMYTCLQLTLDSGIWIETPDFNQLDPYATGSIYTNSIPQVIELIKTLNSSSTLNNVMKINYLADLQTLLNRYGYTSGQLASSAGISQTALNSATTIQQAHTYVLNSLKQRYDVDDIATLVSSGVDFYTLTTLPTFEWYRIEEAVIKAAFLQAADAFSVKISEGGLQVTTVDGGFTSIQLSDSLTYNPFRINEFTLASCLGTTSFSVYNMALSEYHALFSNDMVPLMNNKIKYETQTLANLLLVNGLTDSSIQSLTVAEVISQLTGLSTSNLGCLYGFDSNFLSTDLAKTMENANFTRLCGDFLDLSLQAIVDKIRNIAVDKRCFYCIEAQCGANSRCVDVPDSYECPCNQGYTGDGKTVCFDTPECALQQDDCVANADCQDAAGSYTCTCSTGYKGDGKVFCEDKNECEEDPTRCGNLGICRNTVGSFDCDCQNGYEWNGVVCTDINECTRGTHSCHIYADCKNEIGSYRCECKSGQTGTGFDCSEILECNFGAALYPCNAKAQCVDTLFSYKCTCNEGYTGDGKICTDINECDLNLDDCHINANCVNLEPSFTCSCKGGFTPNGDICEDINECTTNAHDCHVNADCRNFAGSFNCVCKDGFNGDGRDCYVAQVSFERPTYSINEGSPTPLTVNLQLSNVIDQAAFISIVASGSATQNVDYTISQSTFLFQAGGSQTASFTVTMLQDEKLESGETIILALQVQSSSGTHVEPSPSLGTTTITIIDDDNVNLAFTQTEYSISESNNAVTIGVEVISGLVERDISASFTTASGTAIQNLDFSPMTTQMTFSTGDSTTRFVSVPILPDLLTEGNEEFTVQISSSDPDVQINQPTAKVVIVDDDVATVKLDKNTYSVTEGGSFTVQIILDVEFLATTVNARLSAADPNLVSVAVSFAPNSVKVQSVTVSSQQDVILENDDTYSLTLSSESAPSLITTIPSTAVVTVIDDDVVFAEFERVSYTVGENENSITVKVVVTGAYSKPLSLSVSTKDGDAVSSGDYSAIIQRQLLFPVNGANEQGVTILIQDNNVAENNEKFTLELQTADNDIRLRNSVAEITIIDNDVVTVGFEQPEYSVNENGGTVEVAVRLLGSLDRTVDVRYETRQGSAVPGSDYVSSDGIIQFSAAVTRKTILLNIQDTDNFEAVESFHVDLYPVGSGVSTMGIVYKNTTTITIIDDDVLTVSFSASLYYANEESKNARVGLIFDRILETEVDVSLTPQPGTATSPADYPFASYTAKLTPGPQRTITADIVINDDGFEEDNEYFLLNMATQQARVVKGDPSVANITILLSDDVFFCNPNANKYPCHNKASCADVPGSFVCTCSTGYTGDGQICNDIDECKILTCPFNAQCINNLGSYTCKCQSGFRGDGTTCTDINECAELTHDCDSNATCDNNVGGHTCKCKPGYEKRGGVCLDINECNIPNICQQYAICSNTLTSYRCDCDSGFREVNGLCIDIKECEENLDRCHPEATCANSIGSYKCTCKSGYTGSGFLCTDIDECSPPEQHDCVANSMCQNTPVGSYTCVCKPGFAKIGALCQNIDECAINTYTCPVDSTCRDTLGSYECDCVAGFRHSGAECVDIDECTENSDNCHDDAICKNNVGSFTCECKPGYTGSGTFCFNINECDTSICDEHARCDDSIGSYTCSCNAGYTGDGKTCEDIVECLLGPNEYPCDVRAECIDSAGSYYCVCPKGFTLMLDQSNCEDINECATGGATECHVNADCRNTEGSYECDCNHPFVGDGKVNCVDSTCAANNPCSTLANCSINVVDGSHICRCKDGFTGDGRQCVDIDECQVAGICGPNSNCLNAPAGAYTCGCLPGYQFKADGSLGCEDIKECDGNHGCHSKAKCIEQPGSYECKCVSGYTGSGFFCEDIKECSTSPCDPNASCQELLGSYNCACNIGYTGNGFSCTDINECANSGTCGGNASCSNSVGSYDCECLQGYRGDPYVMCVDINECLSATCESGARCVNKPGSYECVCPEDLYRNGKFCHAFCPFKLDLSFIVDTSDSITSADFTKVKNFMIDIVSKLEIGETSNHIAVINFSTAVEVLMRFNTLSGASLTRSSVTQYIQDNFHQQKGITRIDLALLKANSDVFQESNGMRLDSNVRKVAVIITDGKQTVGSGVPSEPLRTTARRLQERDVTTLVIGIGNEVSREELLEITNMIEENLVEIESFASLENLVFRFINMSCTDVNECLRYTPCHDEAKCDDTLGAYKCSCKTGYGGDGFYCEDVDECINSVCHEDALCQNSVGSFECKCKSGFSGDGKDVCTDLGCQLDCSADAACNLFDGAYKCVCNPGYTGDGFTCEDINECDSASTCGVNAVCDNTPLGSYTCSCPSGFTGNPLVSCADKNECTDGSHDCDINALCTNVPVGSFTCTCNDGYNGDGKSCDDINECDSASTCGVNAVCDNTPLGSYTCSCPSGFTGNPLVSCADRNECTDGSHDCDTNALCTNVPVGSFTCTCENGYNGDGKSCDDNNECELGTHDCDRNAQCANKPGSFECTCNEGYTGDGKTCSGTDCLPACTGNTNCEKDDSGAWQCVCRMGFSKVLDVCTDVDECDTNVDDCGGNSTCSNTPGSFTCACLLGYAGENGKNCIDIDECNASNDCHSNANCMNNVGSYVCDCKTGFSGDGKTCTASQCDNPDICHQNARCLTRSDGSVGCECKQGYSGNGINCEDIDECLSPPCSANSECKNTDGSYTCACNPGYTENASGDCIDDADECQKSDTCHVDQACENYPGSYRCICTNSAEFVNADGFCEAASVMEFAIKVLNLPWTDALGDSSSADFNSLLQRITPELRAVLLSLPGVVDYRVATMSEGSVNLNILLYSKPNDTLSMDSVVSDFNDKLVKHNDQHYLGDSMNYRINLAQSSSVHDHDECLPGYKYLTDPCPPHSRCENENGGYRCDCFSGYEKSKAGYCVDDDENWYFVYAVVFSIILFVILFFIFLLCCLECSKDEERYHLSDDERQFDKRLDQVVAPGVPGGVPRTVSASGSQVLLGSVKDKSRNSEKIAMYEVNPIYDSANG